jgi:hypothetical protein
MASFPFSPLLDPVIFPVFAGAGQTGSVPVPMIGTNLSLDAFLGQGDAEVVSRQSNPSGLSV